MEDFRHIVNESIRVGLEHNITSKFKLQSMVYHNYNKIIYSAYAITAIFRAAEILKGYRKAKRKNPDAKRPFMRKNILVMDNQRYQVVNNCIRFPIRPRQFAYIQLNHHVAGILARPNLKLGSITLTDNKICISYSLDVPRRKPLGYVGIDMNLENVTCCDESGNVSVIDMHDIISTKMKYRQVLSHFRRNDSRIQRKLKQKYGMKQRNKESTFLHQRSKEIASTGKQVIMENLTGMKKLYRRGNGQGGKFRFRMNSWSRFKLQGMNHYKSVDTNGFGIIMARPNGTSSKCAICGKKLVPEEHRMMWCPVCCTITDRDVNASRNILARGLAMLGQAPARFEPDAAQGEAMKQSKDVEQIASSLLVE